MDFLSEIYIYGFEGIRNNVYEYRFISKGEKDVIKVVTVRPLTNRPNVYNLGFGNLEIGPDGKERVNDLSTDNNLDHKMVLNTAFACMLHFLKQEPKAQVVLFGNTDYKHLYYKQRISAYIEQLEKELRVIGYQADYEIEYLDIEIVRKGKNGKERKRIMKTKNVDTLKIKRLISAERFNKSKVKAYDFILFSLI